MHTNPEAPLLRSNPKRRGLIIVVLVIGAVLFGVFTPHYLNGYTQPIATEQTLTAANQEEAVTTGELKKGTPQYKTLLPKDKTIQDLGGWTRVSPPNRDPVFAYVDAVGNIPLKVSQQPLPKEFLTDTPDRIAQLAQAYSATKRLQINDTTVYLGTSAKGPQSLIFTKNGLLLLIKASAAVTDDQWRQYISALQ